KSNPIKGNILVVSASSGAQTANAYPEQGHNLFTYELLKALKTSKGCISLGALFNTVSANTAKTANNKLNVRQTPTLIIGQSILDNWDTWKLL
ncbi:MAG: hypothetical protein ACRCZB_04865, partial [Bacteroidales bacterium]